MAMGTKTQHKFVAYKLSDFKDVQQHTDKDRNFGIFTFPKHNLVIYWNVPEHILPAFSKGEKMDEFTVEVDETATPVVEFNKLVLNHLTTDRIHVVAGILAQSVILESLEKQVDKILEDVSIVDTKYNLRKMHTFIRQTIKARNLIVGELKLLDRPDLLWSDKIMDTLYNDLKLMFDLEERFQAIDYKLKTIYETLDLYLASINHQKSYRLEWSVVILVAVEAVIMVIEFLTRK
jgi:uncharacterized Rmd1/YagE family protein